jgi:hypothetical protein
MGNLRQCSDCSLIQPIKNFYKNPHSRGGFLTICISCIKKKNNNPTFKKHKKEYMKNYRKEYLKRPEVIEHIKKKKAEYRTRPDVREKRRLNALEYNNKPRIKERRLKQRSSVEFKIKRKAYYKEYFSRLEVIQQRLQYQKEYYQKPETKERMKQYLKDNPGLVKKWNRNHSNHRKGYGITTLFESPFPDDIEVDYHHFNSLLMIPMPRTTHRFVSGSAKMLGDHFAYNEQWIGKLYCLDLTDLFSEERSRRSLMVSCLKINDTIIKEGE